MYNCVYRHLQSIQFSSSGVPACLKLLHDDVTPLRVHKLLSPQASRGVRHFKWLSCTSQFYISFTTEPAPHVPSKNQEE